MFVGCRERCFESNCKLFFSFQAGFSARLCCTFRLRRWRGRFGHCAGGSYASDCSSSCNRLFCGWVSEFGDVPVFAYRCGATSVIDVFLDLLIAEQNGVLTIVASDGKTFTPTSTITAGSGWQKAGFDSNNFYVHRNSAPLSSLPSSNWRLVQISRASKNATLLASGAGNLASVSMGANFLYGTLATVSGFSLNKFSKTTPGLPQVLEETSTKFIVVPLAFNQGVQMLFRASLSNGMRTGSGVETLDQNTNAKIYAALGATLFDVIRTDSVSLNNSSNAEGVVFIGGPLTSAGELGAGLITYNAARTTATPLGIFPTANKFGSAQALSVTGGATGSSFATGSLLAVSGTTYLASPRRYFSFNLTAAGSIVYSTSVK